MRLLILTLPFTPSIGGVETVVSLLASEWAESGHEVCVGTLTPGEENKGLAYKIVRNPNPVVLWSLYRWADIVFLQGVSARLGWPAVLMKKRVVITHHLILHIACYQGFLRVRLMARAQHVAVSRAVAASLPCSSIVILNPYDSRVFRDGIKTARIKDLVFVGRLCAEKGAALLLNSLAKLAENGLRPSLTLVGDGSQRLDLERLVWELGLQSQVEFTGWLNGESLASCLRQHQLAVVPSLWEEPFGIVALEAIACGCGVIGSNGGGLPEAIGPCGSTFVSGDVMELEAKIAEALSQPALLKHWQTHAPTHLANHQSSDIALRYLREASSDNISKEGQR